jgi:hypothetical protein
MAQLVFEANNFAEISNGMLREYILLATKDRHIKYGELAETLLDVERYEQPKRKKVRQGREVDLMLEERQVHGYGYTNIQILYGALYDPDSPVRDEDSSEGKRFRFEYGVLWELFIELIRELKTRYQVNQHLRRLK